MTFLFRISVPIIPTILSNVFHFCAVFVYGATGAGKTFTMLGSDEMPGIISLTMRSLFEKIEEIDDKHFDIGISYLEVGLLVHKNA